MYVLADLEWVENEEKRISFSQIAMVRVDENWMPVSSVCRRIRPVDASFHLWQHMAYTGGSADDFLNAQDVRHTFREIADWLRPDDTVCWWFSDSKARIRKYVPAIANKQIVLDETVADFLGEARPYNPYRIGKKLHLELPEAMHDSGNDVEMMRRVLAQLRFPQTVLDCVSEEEQNARPCVGDMEYYVDIGTNTIHKKDCPGLLETGHLKGYHELTKPIGKGCVPCECVKAEFRAARRQRNQSTIARSDYRYLYSPDSSVFHRRECKAVLNSKEIRGSVYYQSCTKTGRQPCKICNPVPEQDLAKPMRRQRKKRKISFNVSELSADERRALNRHRQALEQRRSVERNSALSPEKHNDLCTLSQPAFAFFAARGYKTFHLRNCKKLSGITNVVGFSRCNDALKAGYRPCKHCKPKAKFDVEVSLPIYSTKRCGESAEMLKDLCDRYGYKYREEAGMSQIETEVGIWKINAKVSPYRLEHINLTMNPENRTDFHRQPRLFLSLRDTFYYIKRHDEGLILTWKETEYVPKK